MRKQSFNPYFIGLPILIVDDIKSPPFLGGFNPYFIGLPILIQLKMELILWMGSKFQSLFYWITYSYYPFGNEKIKFDLGFNPYFIGLPILIALPSFLNTMQL